MLLALLFLFPRSFNIVHPLSIEIPHSIPLVVTNWNLPMHKFLKNCEYTLSIGHSNVTSFDKIMFMWQPSQILVISWNLAPDYEVVSYTISMLYITRVYRGSPFVYRDRVRIAPMHFENPRFRGNMHPIHLHESLYLWSKYGGPKNDQNQIMGNCKSSFSQFFIFLLLVLLLVLLLCSSSVSTLQTVLR